MDRELSHVTFPFLEQEGSEFYVGLWQLILFCKMSLMR